MRKARIFISCGQKDHEKKYGIEAADYFRQRGFDPYFAEEIQTPEGLTQNIFNALKHSEYFISINFDRDKSNFGSLFIQQEFSIAAFLELPMLSFTVGKNIELDGVSKYLILKPIKIVSEKELINNLKKLTNNWDPNSINQFKLTFDHHHSNIKTLNQPERSLSNWLHITLQNQSNIRYAKNCYAYIELIEDIDKAQLIIKIDDYKTELIWASTGDISLNIPQKWKKDIDALCWYQGENIIQFPQRTTSTLYGYPNLPYGKYRILYVVISDNFPIAKMEVIIEFTSTGIAILTSNQIE